MRKQFSHAFVANGGDAFNQSSIAFDAPTLTSRGIEDIPTQQVHPACSPSNCVGSPFVFIDQFDFFNVYPSWFSADPLSSDSVSAGRLVTERSHWALDNGDVVPLRQEPRRVSHASSNSLTNDSSASPPNRVGIKDDPLNRDKGTEMSGRVGGHNLGVLSRTCLGCSVPDMPGSQ